MYTQTFSALVPGEGQKSGTTVCLEGWLQPTRNTEPEFGVLMRGTSEFFGDIPGRLSREIRTR